VRTSKLRQGLCAIPESALRAGEGRRAIWLRRADQLSVQRALEDRRLAGSEEANETLAVGED